MERLGLFRGESGDRHPFLRQKGEGIGHFRCHAYLLQVGERFSVIHAHAGNGLAVAFCQLRAFQQNLLVFRAEGGPDLGVNAHKKRVCNVVPVRDIGVVGPYFNGNADAVYRILLSVHHALLKAGGGFCPVHVHRVGSQRAEGVYEDGAAHHTYLQVFHIFRCRNGKLAVGKFAEAVFSPADDLHSLALYGLDHHFAGCPSFNGVQSFVAVRFRSEHEWQGGQVQLLHLRRPVDGGGKGEVNGAVAHHEEFRCLFARQKLTAEIRLDDNAPFRAPGDQIGKIGGRKSPAGGGTGNHAELVFRLVVPFACGKGGECGNDKDKGCKRERDESVHGQVTPRSVRVVRAARGAGALSLPWEPVKLPPFRCTAALPRMPRRCGLGQPACSV